MSKIYPLTELEQKAWYFAKEAHEGAYRKFSGVAYFDGHVRHVFKLVRKITTDEVASCAALLHDVVEDTDYTNEDILREFGNDVYVLVKELTSIDELVLAMGKPEYLLDKMLTMSDKGLLVKLCDRYQNLSDHFSSTDKFRQKYYNETQYIITRLVKNRQLNKKHRIAISWIYGIMNTMKRRYVLEYKNFDI